MMVTELTRTAPHVRGPQSMASLQVVRLVAILPVIVAAVVNTGYQSLRSLQDAAGDIPPPGTIDVLVAGLKHVGPVLLVALLTVGVWERIFSDARRQRFDVGVLMVAVVFTLLTHPATKLGHVVFALSFALVFGRGVFGGEGKTFVNPALLAVAVLQISFPTTLTDHPVWTGLLGYSGTRLFTVFHQEGISGFAWMGLDWGAAFLGNTQGMMGTTSVLAILIGALVLISKRMVSWQLMAAQIAGLIVASSCAGFWVGETLPWYWHLVLGSFAFGMVFVASDPGSSASTDIGRWVQGLVMGAAIVMIRVANPSHPDGVVAVLLIGSMLAPLIDHLVVWFNIRNRGRRDG